ncbi:MAG TPA: fumarylacetoacetate hydrolase family protein [Vitreimonas sp.]|uniref:fumarylacetoacetate hydrolase family protein n=1 Tax=Vitreimonas sp. TaxID=3069702 RepID=UPI002D436C3D|nr:fumarylacetoacetate hydrolase family protein [Vitreimonas sp.]HYD87866.1 fumarylacetoacetate hydrolase family protein [Vitreimonas sp.]
MNYVIDPPRQPAVAVLGAAAKFPVRRIFCVGRNYADHVREMGNDPKSEPPIFFTKPADAVVGDGGAIPYAVNTSNLHFEVELVLALGKGGAEIAPEQALEHVWGYAVGVDLTRRDRQAEAKKGGAPWDAAKAFDNSAPIGAITPVANGSHLSAGRIWLTVNGETKQEADLSDMIWSASEIIAHLSRSWTLQPGDLVFTGTPAGVGPLGPGDTVECGVEGLAPLRFTIAAR